MSHLSIANMNYTNVVAVTSAGDETLPQEEAEAQLALLNHVLLERYGMDMRGRLGINSTRGKLAQIYIKKSAARTDEEKAREAVKKVDAIITGFNKVLDNIRFPKPRTPSPTH